MPILRKRYASFGREDKTFGIRALIKGDSWLVRIGLYLLLAVIFYFAVQMSHHHVTSPAEPKIDQPVTPSDTGQ